MPSVRLRWLSTTLLCLLLLALTPTRPAAADVTADGHGRYAASPRAAVPWDLREIFG